MGKLRYTKAELEQIVMAQLDNLHALGDLVRLIRQQNEMLEACNAQLRRALEGKSTRPYEPR